VWGILEDVLGLVIHNVSKETKHVTIHLSIVMVAICMNHTAIPARTQVLVVICPVLLMKVKCIATMMIAMTIVNTITFKIQQTAMVVQIFATQNVVKVKWLAQEVQTKMVAQQKRSALIHSTIWMVPVDVLISLFVLLTQQNAPFLNILIPTLMKPVIINMSAYHPHPLS
jgi:hypothetical protein